ncbi:hypothetical protein [Akkermansia sp.]|uniref:hypothetical protein n=1 Tax=Akkermansia sp. TaxID=1872421 RepID=UPI003AB81A11
MAGQPSPEKQMLSVRISRELYHKAKKLAVRHGFTLSDTLVMILEHATRNIILNEQDYERIAQETAEARKRRRSAS